MTTAFRIFLIIPQAIVLAILGIGTYVCLVIAFFAVLFTGKWPEGLRKFVLGFMRWWLRVLTYGLLLTDEYPPFALD